MNAAGRTAVLAMIGGLAGLLLAVAAPARPAVAHASLAGSDPANGSILPNPPERVVLTFSEPVRPVTGRIVIVGPRGERVEIGELTAERTEVTIPLAGPPDDIGTYLVSYWVVSQDGHPVSGGLTYSVGTPSTVPRLPDDQMAVGDPTVAALVGLNKYLGYVGLVLLVGPVLMLAMLWPPRLPRRGVSRLPCAGLALVAVSTLVGLWLQAPYTTGASLLHATTGVPDVLTSPLGVAYLVRIGVLVPVALLLRPLLAGRAARWQLLLLGGLGLVGLGTWPVAGHPIAAPAPAVSILADMIHIGAAALWIGGLVVLAGFLLRLANDRELGEILPTWSRWAQVAVAVLLLAGLVRAATEIGQPAALVTTAYGRLLLVKVGLVAAVVVVAGYSLRLVRTRQAANHRASLRKTVAVEAAVLAAVLVMSSVLVQTTPGRSAPSETELASASNTSFSTTLDSDLYSLHVTVAPTVVGSSVVRLAASTREGQPQQVEEWRATAALPAAGIEPLDIPMLALADGHAVGQVQLLSAGEWEFRFTLRTSDFDNASVNVTIRVSQ